MFKFLTHKRIEAKFKEILYLYKVNTNLVF